MAKSDQSRSPIGRMAEYLVFCDDCDLNTAHADREEAREVKRSHHADHPDHDTHIMQYP